MNKQPEDDLDTMQDEYDIDYSKAETGKYYKLMLKAGYRPVTLDPDVAKVFENAVAVNDALRSLIELSNKATSVSKKKPARKSSAKRVKPVRVIQLVEG